MPRANDVHPGFNQPVMEATSVTDLAANGFARVVVPTDGKAPGNASAGHQWLRRIAWHVGERTVAG